MKYSKLVWIVVAVGLLGGCHSLMDRRISAHKDAWEGLSEQDRQRLKRGHLNHGDTEEMVLIALGPPDRKVSVTSLAGERQTVWFYDLLEQVDSNYSPYDPMSSPPHYSDRERSVVFHDGVVVDQISSYPNRDKGVVLHDGVMMDQLAFIPEDAAKLQKLRAELTAENMVARLDSLVALTLEQKVNAHGIFTKANDELLVFNLEERPLKGAPIRIKMRADIRALLNAKQQAKYDVSPQHLGGGSMKRP